MASIRTIFSLIDNMSSPLQRIEANMRRAQRTAEATGASMDGIGSDLSNAVANQSRFNAMIEAGNRQTLALKGTIKGMVATYIGFQAVTQGVSNFVRLSDTLTSAEARLAGIVDETQTLEELSQKVFDSAQRSRGAYASTAQFVARVGQMASDLFTNDELVRFAETLNKQMVINGTSTWEAEAAMTQLSQALGSGVLRGEELNSVFEQAPGVISLIADYLDVDIGQIRAMASEGMLTAEVVKNAVLSGADEIDKAFESMPMTWAQTWQKFANEAAWSLRPLSELWSQALNSSTVQSTMTAFASLIGLLAQGTAYVVNAATNWEHFDTVLNVVKATVGVGLVYAFGLLLIAGDKAFTWLTQKALASTLAFATTHPVLTTMIVIMGLAAAAATEMGLTFEDVVSMIAGGAAGAGNVIRWAFQNAWMEAKVETNNALQWIMDKITSFINWTASKVNNNKLLDAMGIKMDTVDFTPNYQSYDWVSVSEAFQNGYNGGSSFASQAMSWVGDKLSGITDIVDQATGLGSGLNVGTIPTAEDIGFDTSGLEDSSDDTAKSSETTAENTKNIADTLSTVASDMAYFRARVRGLEMQRIEQNIKLDINAPISGTGSAEIDGFLKAFTGALETELKNSKRSIATAGV